MIYESSSPWTVRGSGIPPDENIINTCSSNPDLADAEEMLHSITSTITSLHHYDTSREEFDKLNDDFETFLTTFSDKNYHLEHHSELLCDVLSELWMQYEGRVIRLLREFDDLAKRQARAGIFQRRLGSAKVKVSADITHITTRLKDLSTMSAATLSTLLMKAHLSGGTL